MTGVRGGIGSAEGMVGLDGLRGLFQPKYFCDVRSKLVPAL